MSRYLSELNLPAISYEACPKCRSEELFVTDAINFMCLDCDWSNDCEFVAKGGLDKLIFEYEKDRRLERSKQVEFYLLTGNAPAYVA